MDLNFDSNRRLEIDEEGYPLVDGVRVEDALSFAEIFSNLSRFKSSSKSPWTPIVTLWGGVPVWVDSFSSPLIVQDVDCKSANSLQLIFLGGLSFEVSLRDLMIDEWSRLHAYVGPERIESTFSRKAQFKLLMSLQENFEFQKFREPDARVENFAFWDSAYVDKRDSWDLGRVSPSFVQIAQKVLSSNSNIKKVLVPGAGRGYEAQWLLQQSLEVVAEDFSIHAKNEFLKLHPSSGVRYECRDFFENKFQNNKDSFDAICEFIFFCAIDPNMRRAYFERCRQRLNKGGILFGVFFVNHAPGGPPFSTTPWELRERSRGLFELKFVQVSQGSVEARVGKEYECIFEAV